MATVKAFLAAGADVNENASIFGDATTGDRRRPRRSSTCCSTRRPNAMPRRSSDLSVQGSKARPIEENSLETPWSRDRLKRTSAPKVNKHKRRLGLAAAGTIHITNWHISDKYIHVDVRSHTRQ